MIGLLLAVAVLGQVSPNEPIERLIRVLAEDSEELRRQATVELLSKGRAALPLLTQAAEKAAPAHRARIQSVIDQISRAPAPGQPKPSKPDFQPGKLILLASRPDGLQAGASKEGDAVLAALKWFVRHQGSDGSWCNRSCSGRCEEGARCEDMGGEAEHEIGTTGLALLAFASAGYTSASTDALGFGDAVRRGQRFLFQAQARDGRFGEDLPQVMYDHAIAMRALATSLAFDPTREELKKSVLHGAEYLFAARNPGKGWRYRLKPGDNDTSVTAWAGLAALELRDAGVKVPQDVVDGALAWFDEATDVGSGLVGYNRPGTGKVFMGGVNQSFANHPTMTAGAALVRLLAGRKGATKQQLEPGLKAIADDPPSLELDHLDYYYWHMATLAICQADGAKGARWTAWRDRVNKSVLGTQRSSGCATGSWAPIDRWSFSGGRVYATAINAMTLMAPTMYGR